MNLLAAFEGQHVVVRSPSRSGVWMGILVGWEGATIALRGGRRAWSWTGAGTCSGLAVIGPTGGKIALPVDAVVYEVCEVLLATPEAVAAWARVKPWTGREN